MFFCELFQCNFKKLFFSHTSGVLFQKWSTVVQNVIQIYCHINGTLFHWWILTIWPFLTISTTITTNIQMLFILWCWDDHFISVSAITPSTLTTILTNIQMFKCSPTIFRCSTIKMFRCLTTKMFRCLTTTMFRIWTSDVLPAKCSDVQPPKCSDVQPPKCSESELQMFDHQNVPMFILCCLDEHLRLLQAILEGSPQSERWTISSFNEDYGLC